MDKFIKIGSGAWGSAWKDPYYLVDQRGMAKTASGEPAPKFHPRIEEYLATTPFSANDLVMVVVPLGAFESWGQNVNGDGFHREWLEPENPDWGHRSFENHANAFQHHQNKVSDRGFGKIPVATFDRMMDRVEVVFRIDREKAGRVGAGWVPTTLDRGDMIDLSMGANVPWDECSKCSNKAKTQKQYCTCLRTQMNQIQPDGKLVYAKNPYPKFFDLSFVIIRAAKEAAILQKVASAGMLSDQDFESLLSNYAPPSEDQQIYLRKTAASSQKLAADKAAEIEKHAPVVYSTMVHPLYRTEEPLPEKMLEELSGYSFPESLASLATTGIVLSPQEFQYLYLARNGDPDGAHDLHRQRCVFPPQADSATDDGGDPQQPQHMARYQLSDRDAVPHLLSLLKDWIPKRSVLQPFVSKRILITMVGGRTPREPEVLAAPSEQMDKLAGEYDKYLNGMVHLPAFLKSAMLRHGDVFDVFASARFDPTAKIASFRGDTLIPALALVLPTYLLAAKWRRERRMGREDLSMAQEFVADHPVMSSIGLLTGYRAAGGHRLLK